jgi:hypothetical protein
VNVRPPCFPKYTGSCEKFRIHGTNSCHTSEAHDTVSATLTDGRNLDARFAVSLVFVRRDGQWKVLHGHYSVPAKM